MSKEHEIWKYQREDDTFEIKVFEKDNGIIVLRLVGIVSGRGSTELYNFIDGYAKKVGRKISVMADNTKVTKTDRDARKVATRFIDANSPVEKFATFGNNFAMQAFLNLYATLTKMPARFFPTENEAEAWLLASKNSE